METGRNDPESGFVERATNDPNDMYITLEPEFYTCAFVSPLQLGELRATHERLFGECFFTLAMLFVAGMQCITVFGMSTYLAERDTGYTDEFKLSMALFAEGGSTLSQEGAHDMCGRFSQIAVGHVGGLDDHSLKMTDGTMFKGAGMMPMFHSYKMPSGSWVFNSISGDESYVDKLLRVLHVSDWHTSKWGSGMGQRLGQVFDARVEFGTLLVIMLSVLWYHVLFELRKIFMFATAIYSLFQKGVLKGRTGTTTCDADGRIVIEYLNTTSLIVGCLCVTMRCLVAIMMMTWGTNLLGASWNKLSLVLNSLAIGIVFELDVIIAYAVVDHNTMDRVEKLHPIKIRMPTWICADNRKGMTEADTLFSAFMLFGVFVAACGYRAWQVDVSTHQLHNAAALCLFAGPTPHGRQDLLAPVPGFCESLLSFTCAPNVTGPGQQHGPCLVTDQNLFSHQSPLMLYPDTQSFSNMYHADGHRQSMVDWGEQNDKLTQSKTWSTDKNLDLFRRACLQLYQPTEEVGKRVVDESVGLTTYSAPFYCPREKLFKAVFADAVRNFDEWRTTFDLQGRDVVAALDHCHEAYERNPKVSDMTAAAPAAAPPAPSTTERSVHVPSADSGHPLPINALATPRFSHRLHMRHKRKHPEVPAGIARRHRSHREVSRQVISSGEK